jgi:class 3 adenylate cyclase/tetratricopeptide (TPR) repeat protein
MTGIAKWLAAQGLERYVPAFEAAEIDLRTLPCLTDDDLREIGLPLGPRRKILSSRDTYIGPPPASDITAVPIAERRQITVMFVDLVGSTNLSTRVDPEVLSDLLTSYKSAVAEEVANAGGTVAKYLGDGVLVYFGWPKAREDAAECAIRCAFRVRDRVGKIRAPSGDPLQSRTGIATGLVVAGGAAGSGNAREDAVAGEVLNLAARLQALAEPDGICVSARVQELVGQLFEFESRGEHQLSGFDRAVAAWRPLRQASQTNRFAAKHSTKRPLVGRDDELASLAARWSEVVDGEGRAVLIQGEPGIGKSRLLEELRAVGGATRHTFIGLQCSAFHQTKPLYPIIEHLSRAANIVDGDDPPSRLAKLKALLTAAEMPIESALPFIAALLSVPPDEAGYALPDLPPAQRKLATIAALSDWIRRIAEEEPLMLHLEDAHWADATTLEVMTVLINAIGTMPLMVVITGRQEFAPPWAGRAKVSVIGLDRLNDCECEGLVREILTADEVSKTTIEQIVSRADGNPLFVEELSAAVLGTSSNERPVVPDTLQSSLMARLDQLGEAKRTAQLCAVLGRRFARALLAQFYNAAMGLLDTNLSLLVANDIIYPVGRAREGRYEFKHALVRDAAYESLLLAERRRLHERCGRYLEQDFPEVAETEPELLAYHFAQASLALEAASYFERAGDRASNSASYIEAIASYREALRYTAELAAGEERDERELRLLLELGPALSIIDGAQNNSVREVYERAEVLGRTVDDLDGRFKALWGLWYNTNVRRDYSGAAGFADQLVVLSEQSHDDAHVLEALHCRWSSAMFRGECKTSISDAERGVKLYQRDRHHRLAAMFGGHDPGVCAHGVAASSQVTAGQFDTAMRNMFQALALAEELDHPHSTAHALMVSLSVAATAGDYDNLRKWAEALATLAETYNFPPQRAVASFFLEWGRAQTGELDLAKLRSTFNAVVAIGPLTLVYVALHAEELHKAGHDEEALSVADHFVGALKFPFGFYLPEVLRVRGECLAALGGEEDAMEQLQHAAELALDQGSQLFALRAAIARARSCSKHDAKYSAMADVERSLAAIGTSGWPEIAAAREMPVH